MQAFGRALPVYGATLEKHMELTMKTLFFSLCVVLTLANQVSAQVIVDSEPIESSVQVDLDSAVLSYMAETTLGGYDYYEFDMESERWLVVTASGDVVGGQISQKAVDEYRTHGWNIPCFTSPWAFAGCLVLIGIGDQVCDNRTAAHLRALKDHCGPGSVPEIRRIGGCGTVESYGCVPLDPRGSERDDGVDP